MSGETKTEPSGWTVDTLHSYWQAQFVDLRSMLQERYETQTKAVDAAFLAQQTAMQTALTAAERAVQTALLAAEKAVIKAETASDKRFESVNEFRSQLADQAATFMPRAEAEQRISVTGEKIASLEQRYSEAIAMVNSRLDLTSGGAAGSSKLQATIFAVVASIVGVGGLVAAIVANAGR